MKGFADLYGRAPDSRATARGRVNLIGEHTDYNGGWVMPVGMTRTTTVELAVVPGNTVTVWSAEFSKNGPTQFELGAEQVRDDWLDYVQGITYVLRREGLEVPGFLLRIHSTVPPGSGLSSSAALEMALLLALAPIVRLPDDPARLATLGQRAENEFVGAPVGIMDQLAALLASPDAALMIDIRALTWERIPLPPSASLLVIDSGIRHRNVGGEYGRRRAECQEAAALLGVSQLRDLDESGLGRVARLPEPINRRARHVITENARVLHMADALRAEDLVRCGDLLRASHRSLRDDYEVSLSEIDAIVAIADAHPAVYGARLTGGGFGGCVIILGRSDAREELARHVLEHAAPKTGTALSLIQ